MATPKFELARSLVGGPVQMVKQTAGAAFSAGDPLVMSSGKVVKATGGADTVPIKFVAAQDAAADGDVVLCYPALETTVFRVTGSGSPAVGAKYGLAATTLVVDGTNTTQTRVQVIGVDEVTSTLFEVVCLGWIA